MTLKQTLKEKWEANSIIFVVSLMGAAFVTGFGVDLISLTPPVSHLARVF